MSPRISMDALLDRLAQHGLSEEEGARRALQSTLSVLGERLPDEQARMLADVLPAELAESVEGCEFDFEFGTEELFERVRRREHTTAARAREHAQIVLRVLGGCLGHDRQRQIASALPELAGELLLGGRGERCNDVAAADLHERSRGAETGSH